MVLVLILVELGLFMTMSIQSFASKCEHLTLKHFLIIGCQNIEAIQPEWAYLIEERQKQQQQQKTVALLAWSF
jgi:hypothetical protein